jgi:hypothetical protein
MNNFIKSVESGEVQEYLLGKGNYFVRDFEMADIHNPSMKWNEISESFLLDKRYINEFWNGMLKLLDQPDLNLGLWYFNLHLENYVRLVKNSNIQSMPKEIVNLFLLEVSKSRDNLLKEKRKELFILYDSSNMYKAIQYNLGMMGFQVDEI